MNDDVSVIPNIVDPNLIPDHYEQDDIYNKPAKPSKVVQPPEQNIVSGGGFWKMWQDYKPIVIMLIVVIVILLFVIIYLLYKPAEKIEQYKPPPPRRKPYYGGHEQRIQHQPEPPRRVQFAQPIQHQPEQPIQHEPAEQENEDAMDALINRDLEKEMEELENNDNTLDDLDPDTVSDLGDDE